MPTDSFETPYTSFSRSRYPDTTSVSEFVSGTVTCTTGGFTFANGDLFSGVRLKGHELNSHPIGIGTAAQTGNAATGDLYPIEPAEEVFIDIDKLDKVFITGFTAGLTMHFIGS